MYHNKNRKLDWTLITVSIDLLALYLSLIFFSLSCNFFDTCKLEISHRFLSSHFWSLLFIPFAQIYFLRVCASYIPEIMLRHEGLWPALSKAFILSAIVCYAGIHAFIPNSPMSLWIPLAIENFLAFLIVGNARKLTKWFFKKYFTEYTIERIIFIGWSKRMDRILTTMSSDMGHLQHIVGFIRGRDGASAIFAEEKHHHPLGELKDLPQIIQDYGISMIIVDGGTTAPDEESIIARACSQHLINMQMIPSAFDIWSSGLTVQVVSGIPLLGIHEMRHERLHNRIMKRAIDIVGAIVGLSLSAPIILVCSILIKRESPGPVIYKQVRIGKYGRPFTMYKLRSMKLDAEKGSGPVWTKAGDPRRLKIGAFLRAWNIDEIPQFWNVLIGNMSLVGPRPERPEFVEAFNQTVRHYNLRHTCKPGMTGWAAIHGLRGNTSLVDRLEYDLYYVENWSLDKDLYIMFRTLLPPKNAY